MHVWEAYELILEDTQGLLVMRILEKIPMALVIKQESCFLNKRGRTIWMWAINLHCSILNLTWNGQIESFQYLCLIISFCSTQLVASRSPPSPTNIHTLKVNIYEQGRDCQYAFYATMPGYTAHANSFGFCWCNHWYGRCKYKLHAKSKWSNNNNTRSCRLSWWDDSGYSRHIESSPNSSPAYPGIYSLVLSF